MRLMDAMTVQIPVVQSIREHVLKHGLPIVSVLGRLRADADMSGLASRLFRKRASLLSKSV